jgi:rare lipoprotein A
MVLGGWSVRIGVAGIIAAVIGVLAFSALSGCSSSNKSAKLDPFAGQGSPRYPGNGPLPRGGGRYQLGEAYQVAGRWFTPREQPGYDKVGIASWYGPQFHRRQTSNGEWFDMNYLTAAHATLPLPSYAKVTNLQNGREVIVRINDRGPFVGDRIIDLSRKAATVLAFKEQGRAQVRVQYLGPAPLNDRGSELMALNERLQGGGADSIMTAALAVPEKRVNYTPKLEATSSVDPGSYFVQVGSFRDPDNAERARAELADSGPVVVTAVSGATGQLYRVRIGPLSDASQANRALQDAVNAGHSDARVVTAQEIL